MSLKGIVFAYFTMSLAKDSALKWGLHRPVRVTLQWWLQPMKRKANDQKSPAAADGFGLNSLGWGR